MDLQPLIDELLVAQATIKKEEREKAAKSGHALPDGSYPIENRSQLEDAIGLNGNSKSYSRETVRAHIRKRAKALGASDMIPDSWDSSSDDDKVKQEAEPAKPRGFIEFLKDLWATEKAVEQDAGIPGPDMAPAQPEIGKSNPQMAGKRKKRADDDDEEDNTELQDTALDESVLSPKVTKARVTQEVPILQIDTLKRVVTGVVQTPDVDVRPASMPNTILVYPKSTVQQMAWDFLKNYHNGSIGLRHGEVQQGQIVPQKGENATVVESYLAPIDMTFPNGKTVQQGTWIMSVQINNDSAWDDVQRGDLRAFSLASTKVKFSDLPPRK